MKKALAGPAKRSAKKKPERRAIIAAARQRLGKAGRLARRAGGKLQPVARRGGGKLKSAALRAGGELKSAALRAGGELKSAALRAARKLQPAAHLLFRCLAFLERGLRATASLASRASATLTRERAICGVILASALCLAASQFVDYHAVAVGEPGYAGLPAAAPPTLGARMAGQAHAFLLIPAALVAAVLAGVALKTSRWALGRLVFGVGLVGLAVVLLVDLRAGLDAGAQASRFAGATAVLEDGFYGELASTAGLLLGGALLAWQPEARKARIGRRAHRPLKASLARTQGGRRRARALSRASKAAD